jgi:CheY-like chemotaxis protein
MKTILVVDDEYALVENLTELLRDEGYRVVSAANGKDALERVVAEKPDLILTDLMMPISDGREFVRSVRTLPAFSTTPIIMMSATSKEVALSDSHGPLDVSCFMGKPFPWKSLYDAVVTLIGPSREESGASA